MNATGSAAVESAPAPARSWALTAALAMLTVIALAAPAAATAKQVVPYAFDRSFNGADSTAGPMTAGLERVEINQAADRVYVLENREDGIHLSQFNTAGQAQNWSGLGAVSSFLAGGPAFRRDLAYDNTGHGGGIYVEGQHEGRSLRAFNDDGTVRINSFGWTGNRCATSVGPEGFVWYSNGQGASIYDPDTGQAILNGDRLWEQQTCKILFDSEDFIYLHKATGGQAGIHKYVRLPELQDYEKTWECCDSKAKQRLTYGATPYATLDPTTDRIFVIEGGTSVTEYTNEGQPVTSFGLPEGAYNGLLNSTGIAVDWDTKEVYVTTRRSGDQPGESPVSPRIDVFKPQDPITVPDASTQPPGHPSKTSAVLRGLIDADGVDTTECKFEWGTINNTVQFDGGAVPCQQGDVFTGNGDHEVTHQLKSLTTGTRYRYRVAARNANGQWSYGVERVFEASVAPSAGPLIVERVNTDGARFRIEVEPNGGTTSYHFLVGEGDCSSNPCTVVPGDTESLASRLAPEQVSGTVTGLKPNSDYHVELVAENEAGSVSVPSTFRTYPPPPADDPCPNAHVRQQTSASLLLDCRAYELVSAANAGGYDVESDLVPGQTPFSAFPDADDRVLYGLHFGSVPGIDGSPTNHGLDPYVAQRGGNGWTTRYVGLPAGGMTDDTPYGSPLLAADSGLDTFAFGGPDICDPCFPDGSTNVPLRLSNGSLVKGMAGPLNPAADPAGEVRKPLSDDGTHFVFGSTSKFADGGHDSALTIYDRDLGSGLTQVASTTPAGTTMTGEVAQLDISSDGERILIGRKVGTDAAGNGLYDLFMHVGQSAASVEIADTPGGVQFNGMTSDGSMVYFSTADPLTEDSDTSVDVYLAKVGEASADVTRVSTGAAAGDTDACEPAGFPNSWNSVSGDGDCNTVAFAGGAGVAAADGTFYFVSPERLDGSQGAQDQPNLYVAEPGSPPSFVATIDTSADRPAPPPLRPLATADFTGETHEGPEAMAVDQSTGDVYVYETGSGKVARYTAAGAAKPFTAAEPQVEGNRITGLPTAANSGSQIAIDEAAPSPFEDSIYVTAGSTVRVFGPDGTALGEIDGSANVDGSFGTVCGVAVDPGDGTLYIGDRTAETIWEYAPKAGASTPVSDADYDVRALSIPGFAVCNVAVDGAGNVYGSRFSNGPVRAFEVDAFGSPIATGTGTEFDAASRAVAVDPATGLVFVNEGGQIAVFEPDLTLVQKFAGGALSGSRGVAIRSVNQQVYAPSGGAIARFGHELAPYHPIDHPGVVNGVSDADTHRTSDFQVTRNGRYAVFASRLSLTGASNLGHDQIYRHDSATRSLVCASCATTNAAAKTDTVLAPHGLNVSEDGRVFFTTREGLVLNDTNEKSDAYQWVDGKIGIISTGRSLEGSSLLTVSRDGKNAFFFTRDTLVPEDANGGAVKIYTARQGGGYPQGTRPQRCQAADECRGAGTRQPPPPEINSITGMGPEVAPVPDRCAVLVRLARRSRSTAARLRRRAARAAGRRARRLRANARRAAGKAKRQGRRAAACRRAGEADGQ